MSEMILFSIQDSGADAFMQPFFVQAEGVAIREFGNLCNDKEHPVGKHPEDYTLFRVGFWNERKGQLEGCVPESVCNGLSMRQVDMFDEKVGGTG